MDFYERLSHIKTKTGLNQTEIGEFLGVSQPAYSRLAKGGVARVRVSLLTAFLRKHRINPLFLFGFTDSLSEILIHDKQEGSEIPPANTGAIHDCIRAHPELRALLERICMLDDEGVGKAVATMGVVISGLEKEGSKRNAAG